MGGHFGCADTDMVGPYVIRPVHCIRRGVAKIFQILPHHNTASFPVRWGSLRVVSEPIGHVQYVGRHVKEKQGDFIFEEKGRNKSGKK